ncbi:MAG: P1 family peptidase, partial [Acidimicrobiales bacterium]|nr:P1 family peptidase [Acidimicrobiales bacterium]
TPVPRRPGGLVTGSVRVGELVVGVLVAVNAAGVPGADDALAVDIAALAPSATGDASDAADSGGTPGSGIAGFGNTTIGLVATNARLDKVACNLVAQGAHDGLARSVFPAHTRADGDAFVAAAVGGVQADVDVVRGLAVHAVTQAIVSLAGR